MASSPAHGRSQSHQPFALVGVAGAADLGHLLHEPGEDLRGLIADRAMNGFDDCPMAVITTQ